MSERGSAARVLLAGAAHFALVFAVGFALGTLRVLVLAPRIGERTAELAEWPLMVAASFASAHLVVWRARVTARGQRLALGAFALALLVGAEALLVVPLRGVSLAQDLASRDPLSATAYLLGLALFAAAPALVPARKSSVP